MKETERKLQHWCIVGLCCRCKKLTKNWIYCLKYSSRIVIRRSSLVTIHAHCESRIQLHIASFLVLNMRHLLQLSNAHITSSNFLPFILVFFWLRWITTLVLNFPELSELPSTSITIRCSKASLNAERNHNGFAGLTVPLHKLPQHPQMIWRSLQHLINLKTTSSFSRIVSFIWMTVFRVCHFDLIVLT